MAASLPVKNCSLHTPHLEEVAKVLGDGLKENFREVSVKVVECPDLTQTPWTLAAPGVRAGQGCVLVRSACWSGVRDLCKLCLQLWSRPQTPPSHEEKQSGLCGSPRLVDIGGVPYLMPIADKTKLYNLGEMAALVDLPGAFILGAGAGSYKVAGVNCEMMPNARVPSNSSPGVNLTYIAKVSTQDGSCVLERFNSLEAGPLANLLACEGKLGKVLEIKAKYRTGSENFVTCMRKALGGSYGNKPVALGGVFQIVSGKANLHVMPEFSEKPLNTDAERNNWLKFYEMSAPLICLSVFISHDPGFDLRVEHTHCFSDHGEGGHYHYDTTPQETEYLAYYTLAERLYRIDQPQPTHTPSRD